MQRRFRKAFCAIKEHSTVSYAKVVTFGGFCDLDLVIVKATAPDDLPLPEKYILEILKILSVSPSSFHSFSLSFIRRFGRTHCWKVALKCLLLLHRLLRSLPEHTPFRAELLWARSNGFLSLYPCHFRDDSSSNPEDYTMFIRSYAQLLDEAIDCFALESKKKEEEEEDDMPISLQEKMTEASRIIDVLQQLQSLIDRVMDCRPAGAAARSFIVQSAMKHIIRDSFICYATFRKELVSVLDNLIQMPHSSCILSFGIYKKAALQAEKLCEFYDWCKAKGLCGPYEYPFIERIPEIQIRALETFLNGMWQFTESSSSSPSSCMESNKSISTEDDHDGGDDNNTQIVTRGVVISTKWVKFEENVVLSKKIEEKEETLLAPLIQLDEDGESDNWEVLLDASLDLSCIRRDNYLIFPPGFSSNGYGCEDHRKKDTDGEKNHDQWQMQVYNPNSAFNPFCQPYYIPNHCYGCSAINPTNQ